MKRKHYLQIHRNKKPKKIELWFLKKFKPQFRLVWRSNKEFHKALYPQPDMVLDVLGHKFHIPANAEFYIQIDGKVPKVVFK